MDNDDLPVGRLLSRREALTFLTATGALLLMRCAGADATSTDGSSTGATGDTPSGATGCVARPELTEGPYYVDEELDRSDIRSDPSDGSVRDGTPLTLAFNVSRLASNACAPLEGAIVDVWHCDADGTYSDVRDGGFNTVGKKYLRGYQVTDANGAATFTTIIPGWYRGRAVHMHFKVRSQASASSAYEFTSQLFFDDTFLDRVYASAPYAGRGTRDTRNASDGIYRQGGSQLLLDTTPAGDGYTATFNLALQDV